MSMTSSQALDVLDRIESISARSIKEELLAEAITDPLMKDVVNCACNPFITYGVKPARPKVFGDQEFDTSTAWIWIMLNKLANRELTGGDAKAEIKAAFERLDTSGAELLWRILNKDLRCGITAKTVNTVLPGTIPVFEVMLSKVYEEKRIKAWPVGVEPKMDGMRAMILVKDGKARAFSRVGNHIPALDYLSDQIAATVQAAMDDVVKTEGALARAYIKLLGGDPQNPKVAIDCEAISNGDFYDGGLKRKDEDATGVTLHVFDALPYALLDRPEREINIPFKARRKFAEFIVKSAVTGAPMQMTPLRYAQSHDEIMEITEDHWRRGLEGSMVKLLDGPYVKTKGHIWMKIKKQETLDLRVVGAFEGAGKYEGQLGGLIVEGEADGKRVAVRVGGGFTDDERIAFWMAYQKEKDDPDQEGTLVLGRLCEVEFHEFTPPTDGVCSLRHPRYLRWRDDKDEKLRAAA